MISHFKAQDDVLFVCPFVRFDSFYEIFIELMSFYLSVLQASDRFNINSQLEHLQAKYVGTGHADMNRL